MAEFQQPIPSEAPEEAQENDSQLPEVELVKKFFCWMEDPLSQQEREELIASAPSENEAQIVDKITKQLPAFCYFNKAEGKSANWSKILLLFSKNWQNRREVLKNIKRLIQYEWYKPEKGNLEIFSEGATGRMFFSITGNDKSLLMLLFLIYFGLNDNIIHVVQTAREILHLIFCLPYTPELLDSHRMIHKEQHISLLIPIFADFPLISMDPNAKQDKIFTFLASQFFPRLLLKSGEQKPLLKKVFMKTLYELCIPDTNFLAENIRASLFIGADTEKKAATALKTLFDDVSHTKNGGELCQNLLKFFFGKILAELILLRQAYEQQLDLKKDWRLILSQNEIVGDIVVPIYFFYFQKMNLTLAHLMNFLLFSVKCVKPEVKDEVLVAIHCVWVVSGNLMSSFLRPLQQSNPALLQSIFDRIKAPLQPNSKEEKCSQIIGTISRIQRKEQKSKPASETQDLQKFLDFDDNETITASSIAQQAKAGASFDVDESDQQDVIVTQSSPLKGQKLQLSSIVRPMGLSLFGEVADAAEEDKNSNNTKDIKKNFQFKGGLMNNDDVVVTKETKQQLQTKETTETKPPENPTTATAPGVGKQGRRGRLIFS